MSIVGEIFAAHNNKRQLGLNTDVMGYLGLAQSQVRLRDVSPRGRWQEIYIRTSSGNIYQVTPMGDKVFTLINGRANTNKGDLASFYPLVLSGDLTIELGKPFYFGLGNTSDVVGIIVVDTYRIHFDFHQLTQGRTNSIRQEFLELLYPGKTDQFHGPAH